MLGISVGENFSVYKGLHAQVYSNAVLWDHTPVLLKKSSHVHQTATISQ